VISIRQNDIKEPETIKRGLHLQQAGEWSRAFECYAAVLKKYPNHAVAKYLTGLLWESVNEPRRALDLLTEVTRQRPSFFEAHHNRGVVLQWLGRLDEAKAAYEKALKINPRFGASCINLGNAHLALGDHDEAIKCYDRGAELRPDNVEGQHNRSFVHLLRGRWKEGWADYEMRWHLPGHAYSNPMPPVPRWTGQPLEGKTLLVLQEQGAGDTFMMLRYVYGLIFMGATVILRVPTTMMRLVQFNFPDLSVEEFRNPPQDPQDPDWVQWQKDHPWPACDYAVPFMSLPGIFGTMPDTVPLGDTPYLVAPERRAA
jgi:tetratricopeptide (TPR) repeat protein